MVHLTRQTAPFSCVACGESASNRFPGHHDMVEHVRTVHGDGGGTVPVNPHPPPKLICSSRFPFPFQFPFQGQGKQREEEGVRRKKRSDFGGDALRATETPTEPQQHQQGNNNNNKNPPSAAESPPCPPLSLTGREPLFESPKNTCSSKRRRRRRSTSSRSQQQRPYHQQMMTIEDNYEDNNNTNNGGEEPTVSGTSEDSITGTQGPMAPVIISLVCVFLFFFHSFLV